MPGANPVLNATRPAVAKPGHVQRSTTGPASEKRPLTRRDLSSRLSSSTATMAASTTTTRTNQLTADDTDDASFVVFPTVCR